MKTMIQLIWIVPLGLFSFIVLVYLSELFHQDLLDFLLVLGLFFLVLKIIRTFFVLVLNIMQNIGRIFKFF